MKLLLSLWFLSFQNEPSDVLTFYILTPSLQIGKLRLREVKSFAQGQQLEGGRARI